LQWGCHSLFYPGGTRSRSGALEQQLKLGLLGTVFEAQQYNYQAQGRTARKIFVVPVVLSYHCVLEAPR
jgi:glycerol-3-phosphate O-acyltransferase